MSKLTRADFLALDEADDLAAFRQDFQMPEKGIYMDGNSLGVMPTAVKDRMTDLLENEWAEQLVASWNSNNWFELPYRVGDKIAQIIGADDGEVVVCDTVSINIFKLVAAALQIQKKHGRSVILSEKGNFPTDLYILQGLTDFLGETFELLTVERHELESALSDRTAVVLLTDVHYKTGHMLDKQRITDLAHQHGALMIWDLCHSAGAVPIDLNELGADMAVGCGYKYLNGGPGAPAFLFVARRWQAQIEQPLSGWWGHAQPFEFSDDYRPAEGIGRMLCGTQGILGLATLEVAVDLFLRADMHAVREKSIRMGDLFIELLELRCGACDFEISSPVDAKQRGSQVSFRHQHAYQIMQALIANGVTGDFRAPDTLRFGLTPLYLRYVDVWDAVAKLADIMQKGTWQEPKYNVRARVT